jgi:hypothetical protein
MQTNVLYYGDNLDILRRYLPDAAVDLVYLDPPFNSNRDYNVIFRDESGNAGGRPNSVRTSPEPLGDVLRSSGMRGENRQQVGC